MKNYVDALSAMNNFFLFNNPCGIAVGAAIFQNMPVNVHPPLNCSAITCILISCRNEKVCRSLIRNEEPICFQ